MTLGILKNKTGVLNAVIEMGVKTILEKLAGGCSHPESSTGFSRNG